MELLRKRLKEKKRQIKDPAYYDSYTRLQQVVQEMEEVVAAKNTFWTTTHQKKENSENFNVSKWQDIMGEKLEKMVVEFTASAKNITNEALDNVIKEWEDANKKMNENKMIETKEDEKREEELKKMKVQLMEEAQNQVADYKKEVTQKLTTFQKEWAKLVAHSNVENQQWKMQPPV